MSFTEKYLRITSPKIHFYVKYWISIFLNQKFVCFSIISIHFSIILFRFFFSCCLLSYIILYFLNVHEERDEDIQITQATNDMDFINYYFWIWNNFFSFFHTQENLWKHWCEIYHALWMKGQCNIDLNLVEILPINSPLVN